MNSFEIIKTVRVTEKGTRQAEKLNQYTVVADRRKINGDIRDNTVAFLQKKGFKVVPSLSNKFMVDSHKPTVEARNLLRKENVFVGRPWPSMSTYLRVTVGTADEMKKFQDAFVKVFA